MISPHSLAHPLVIFGSGTDPLTHQGEADPNAHSDGHDPIELLLLVRQDTHLTFAVKSSETHRQDRPRIVNLVVSDVSQRMPVHAAHTFNNAAASSSAVPYSKLTIEVNLPRNKVSCWAKHATDKPEFAVLLL